MMELLHDHRQAHGCLQASLVFLVVHPSPACAPGLAHNTKHAMTKHLALFASLGRLTLSEHISARGEKAAAVWSCSREPGGSLDLPSKGM